MGYRREQGKISFDEQGREDNGTVGKGRLARGIRQSRVGSKKDMVQGKVWQDTAERVSLGNVKVG